MLESVVMFLAEMAELELRHQMADFRSRVILAIAMPKLEMGVARNFSECSAMIEE